MSQRWSSNAHLLLRTCLKAARCAYCASSGTFPNSFRQVVPLVQAHFSAVKSIELLSSVYQVLTSNDSQHDAHLDTHLVARLVPQVLNLTEELTNDVKCKFRAFNDTSLIDIQMSF